MDLVGNVEGCDVIMVDDLIDTAGTLTQVTWPGSEYVVSYHTLMVALCNACICILHWLGLVMCCTGRCSIERKGSQKDLRIRYARYGLVIRHWNTLSLFPERGCVIGLLV